jgi:EAL domain-containing protein (putative c-di-GMP-specific phosphodiesterase class I)
MPALTAPPPHLTCKACRDGGGLDFGITMAFQPIVDVESKAIFAHEALVRGADGAGAAEVLAKINEHNRYRFDQAARVCAITRAAEVGMTVPVSINFLPNAVYRPETCIRVTLEAAAELGFPTSQIIFEVNEAEPVGDRAHLQGIFAEYKRQGFKTAIDDFGAGYAGLALLADFEPDLIKLDMALIRNIHLDRTRRAIISGTIHTCRDLGITVIAEGVELDEEVAVLREMGVRLFEGYRFGRPKTGPLTEPTW